MNEILIDPRQGSGDLVGPLRQLGIPARVADPMLPFGDVQIVGSGPGGRPVLVGVEIKSSSEILDALTDTRFVGHQLVGMLQAYEVRYLLVEGIMGVAPNRELLFLKEDKHRPEKWKWEVASRGQHKWTYEAVESFLRSVERAGIREAYTPDRRATAGWIASLYQSWSKDWDAHKSLARFHSKALEDQEVNPLGLFDATRKMLVAKELVRGMGTERALAAARHFPSVRSMVNATEKDWLQVDGIGKRLAAAIVAGVTEETAQ